MAVLGWSLCAASPADSLCAACAPQPVLTQPHKTRGPHRVGDVHHSGGMGDVWASLSESLEAAACLVCISGQNPRSLGFARTRAFALGPQLRTCAQPPGAACVCLGPSHVSLTAFLPGLQTESSSRSRVLGDRSPGGSGPTQLGMGREAWHCGRVSWEGGEGGALLSASTAGPPTGRPAHLWETGPGQPLPASVPHRSCGRRAVLSLRQPSAACSPSPARTLWCWCVCGLLLVLSEQQAF